jgi:signal transduction histidine kinase
MSESSLTNAHVDMNTSNPWLHRWIYFLTIGLMYSAIWLRSVIGFAGSPDLGLILLLLFILPLIFLGSTRLAHTHPQVSLALIVLEMITISTLLLLTHSIRSDLFAFLFAVTGMQIMQEHTSTVTAAVIGLSAIITFLSLFQIFGVLQAMALTMVYTALSVFLAVYIWSTRQARTIQAKQLDLTAQLQEANHKLEIYARKAQELATTRERQRLARELHDSVTQTIFSMTLATQTARMLMKRDPPQVAGQLTRVDDLCRSALLEMETLVSQLTPEELPASFLEVLRQHLAERQRLDNLAVSLAVEGSPSLSLAEESSLLRIAQEALNNIVKHAGTTNAALRLHFTEPPYMEIEDHGVGFDQKTIRDSGKIGLAGMGERAAEIGWKLVIENSPGQGCLVRVQKGP